MDATSNAGGWIVGWAKIADDAKAIKLAPRIADIIVAIVLPEKDERTLGWFGVTSVLD
jgi:hypothetical protein